MLGFAEAGQRRVECRHDRTFMAEIDLELTQVLALFQQVRRVGMAQGMNVRGFFDAAGQEGEAKGPLQSGARHRLGGGGGALAAVALGREEQLRMAMSLPLLTQELKRALRHRNITIPIALAGAAVQQHALGINIAHLQAQSFPQAQAAGINGAQADAMIQGADAGEDAADFAGGKHDRQFELRIGAGQFQFVGPGALERFFPEQFDGADGLGAGLAGDFFTRLEMDAILADIFGREQVGRFGVKLTELAEAGVIGLFGAWADGQQLQVIGEGF